MLLLCYRLLPAQVLPPKYKPVEVEDEFAKVNKLEQYLIEHPNMTYEQVKKVKPELLEGVDLIYNTNTNFAPTKDMPLVGDFWWGWFGIGLFCY